MKTYGLEKKHLDILYNCISKTFDADIPDVYLFGSRATGKHKKHSDIDLGLISKSKTNSDFEKKLDQLKSELEESDLPYKVDIVDLYNVEPTYEKSINRDKRLLWSKELKEKSSS